MVKNKSHTFYHDCDLPIDLERIMPGVPPNAPWHERFKRALFKIILVSEKNKRASQHFRSTAAFMFEKRRHVLAKHWYIIHPYSLFRTFWERFMAFILSASLLMVPFVATFLTTDETNDSVTEETENKAYYAVSCIDFICLFDVVINFVSGYIKSKTKEIIMDQKQIVRHYLATFFIIDFVSSFPTDLVRVLLISHKIMPRNKAIDMICLVSSILKIFRLKSLIKYLSQFGRVKGFGGHGLRILRISVIMAVYIHWMTCMQFFVPRIKYFNTTLKDINNSSWIKKENMYTKDPWTQYTASLLRTISNVCSIGYGTNEPETKEDLLVGSFNQLTGFMVLAYLTVVVLQQQQSRSASVTKYLELTNQLKDYMDHRQLPKNLQLKVIAYYEHNCHRRYFREEAIVANLSDTLVQDVSMHLCRKLVKNVVMFQGLPQTVIANVIKYLKLEVYLTNDMIIKAGTPGDCMYFISSGTVAVISPTGKELAHLEDGDYFGEIILVTDQKIRTATMIAASICEVYRLNKKDFMYCVQTHEGLLRNMKQVAFSRRQEMEDVESRDSKKTED